MSDREKFVQRFAELCDASNIDEIRCGHFGRMQFRFDDGSRIEVKELIIEAGFK